MVKVKRDRDSCSGDSCTTPSDQWPGQQLLPTAPSDITSPNQQQPVCNFQPGSYGDEIPVAGSKPCRPYWQPTRQPASNNIRCMRCCCKAAVKWKWSSSEVASLIFATTSHVLHYFFNCIASSQQHHMHFTFISLLLHSTSQQLHMYFTCTS